MNHHEEVKVGGPLDEKRLRSIMVRALRLRNLCVSAAEALEYRAKLPTAVRWEYPENDTDGETPILVERYKGEELNSIELHVGCGEMCPVLAAIPFDGDSGGVDQLTAEAIAHSGRDMIDLVREVLHLRYLLSTGGAQ